MEKCSTFNRCTPFSTLKERLEGIFKVSVWPAPAAEPSVTAKRCGIIEVFESCFNSKTLQQNVYLTRLVLDFLDSFNNVTSVGRTRLVLAQELA